MADVFADDYSDDDESELSDFDDDTYIDSYDDWNDASVASHGLTGEQTMAAHPNKQVRSSNPFPFHCNPSPPVTEIIYNELRSGVVELS